MQMQIEDLDLIAQIDAAIQIEMERFQKRIDICLEDMRSKNLLNSSITLDRLAAICRQSFYERLLLAWQVLSASAKAFNYQSDLAERLECYLDAHVPALYADMLAVVDLAQDFADPGEPAFKNFEASICEGRFTAFRQLKPLLAEFCAGLEQTGNRPDSGWSGFSLAGQACPRSPKLDMETFAQREELDSCLFALEFAICGLDDAAIKQPLVSAVRAVRSAIGRAWVESEELCRLICAVSDGIAHRPELAENYADLKTLVADLGIVLP